MTSAQHATAIMRTSRGDHRFGAALSHFSVLNQKDLHDRLAAIHYAAFSRMDENGWSASVIEELFKGNGVSFYLCGQGKINAFAITRSVLDRCCASQFAKQGFWSSAFALCHGRFGSKRHRRNVFGGARR